MPQRVTTWQADDGTHHPDEGTAIRHEQAVALARCLMPADARDGVNTVVKVTPIMIAKAVLAEFNVTRKL